jgi:hypothetical protein
MTNAVLWDVTQCGFCQNRRFGGTYRLQHSVPRLKITVNIVPSWPILVALMMEEIHPSETSVFTKANGAASQKTAFFIVTAEKTSNLT